MTRSFIAALLSISLTFTTLGTAPARADEDVAKVIAGIAGLLIINEAIKKREERKAAEAAATRTVPYASRHTNRDLLRKRDRVRRVAPQSCLRNQWTHRGNRQVYSARCLQSSTRAQLPRNCLFQARTNNGPSRFYSPRCLRENGWRT